MNTLIPMSLFMLFTFFMQRRDQKAIAALTVEEKARLMDQQISSSAIVSLLPVIGMLGYVAFTTVCNPSIFGMSVALVIYMLFIFASTAYTSHAVIQKQLLKASLPESFIRHRSRSAMLQTLAMGVFLAWIMGSYFFSMREIDALTP